MDTQKNPNDKALPDLSESLSDAEATEVKGGAAPASGPGTTPAPPQFKKPIMPRAIDPCW